MANKTFKELVDNNIIEQCGTLEYIEEYIVDCDYMLVDPCSGDTVTSIFLRGDEVVFNPNGLYIINDAKDIWEDCALDIEYANVLVYKGI